jgi:hypothetical protein
MRINSIISNFLISIINKYRTLKTGLKLVTSYNNVFDRYIDEEMNESYNEFKKYFSQSVMFYNRKQLWDYTVQQLEKDKTNLYLEFGVYKGKSLNYFAKKLSNKEIIFHGFDSFQGLNEDWKGNFMQRGFFKHSEKFKLENNAKIIKGTIQETLQHFIKDKENLKVNFLHIDVDTYETTNFILKVLKKSFKKNSIILFDDLHNFPGWKDGEYKALKENFVNYKFLAFGRTQGLIKLL